MPIRGGFSSFFACAVLGVLAVLPYLSVVLRSTLVLKPLPLPVIAFIQGVTNFGIAIALGVFFARKIGLGAPLLEAWLYGRRYFPSREIPWSHA